MPELVCDTSVLQYIHQIDQLRIINLLSDCVIVPPAVLQELETGRKAGLELPNVSETGWIEVKHPAGEADVPLITDMGPGEAEVLMLAIENPNTIAVLDDQTARKAARMLGLKFTGTLGLILDAKKAGHIERIRPFLDKLDELRFYVSRDTRELVLRKGGER